MATFDAQKTTWTADDALHFARRAGFGATPEQAAALAAQSLASVVDAWVGATAGTTAFDAALLKADVISDGARNMIPADPAPHPYRVEAWRFSLTNAQALLAWRMQHSPNPLQEKMALFWHQLLATGYGKVENTAFMLRQHATFRALGRGGFGALLLAVSQDPAMLVWLDSVLNRVRSQTDVANENYAREILELYSLGVDNGYNQQDITNLARAFSGWNYTPTGYLTDPNDANNRQPEDGVFRVFRGQANTSPVDPRYGANLPNWHATGTIAFLGKSFDLGAATNNGEALVGAILTERGTQCAQFLAKRLLTFFVTPTFTAAALDDLQALILAKGFHLGEVLKAIFKSQFFFDAANRFNLYEGPVAWTVRMAKLLCPALPAATVPALPLFPAWRLVAPAFDNAGMKLLDPEGPNGWHEHEGWINSNTARYRGRIATALALNEKSSSLPLFPTAVADWFPAAPASALAVFDRLATLLQPAPIPNSVRDGWLAGLWPGAFVWDGSAATQSKVRELTFLILVSPQAQLH